MNFTKTSSSNKNLDSIKTLIVLGSGGHTMEMAEIVKELDKNKYKPRIYILAKSDKTSRHKIEEIENLKKTSINKNSSNSNENNNNVEFIEIFRSRTVNQSYFTSIITTLLAIFECIPLCWKIQPDLILCNGPGTCVPICFVAYILKLLRLIKKCKIVFIESYCRVKTLSLSGKILLRIVDMFVVQWPDLLIKIGNRNNVKYYGHLL